MTSFEEQASAVIATRPVSFPGHTVGASLVAITAAYFLANSGADMTVKSWGFLAIVISFVTVSALLYLRDTRSAKRELRGRDFGGLLDGLDEAKDYFAGSLDSSDTFRLVVSRIKAILPIRSAVLWTPAEDESKLKCAESLDSELRFNDRLAVECHASRAVVVGREQGRGAAALPLFKADTVCGVLELFFEDGSVLKDTERQLLEAVAVRISPLILSSLAFDRTRDNAVTDPTTKLPNERAFYLVLENQLAEASRKRAERPVTILAMDVKDFEEINRRYGHSTGDAVLRHVAATIKDALRQMDFFARSANDEFLAILPTASQGMSPEVISRVQVAFVGREFKVEHSRSIEIEINFGWAEFGVDGETAHDVVKMARARKSQAKIPEKGNVLSFSQEL